MDRGGFRALLFWLMFFGGGAALAACMILPAWLDYSDARARAEQARGEVADLIYRLKANRQRIEHLLHDPDYQQRVAQEVLGIERPGVESVRIQEGPAPTSAASAPTSRPAAAMIPDVDPIAIARGITAGARRSPFLALFVLDQTRPVVMGIAGVLMLAAIVLLHLPARPRPAERPLSEQPREVTD